LHLVGRCVSCRCNGAGGLRFASWGACCRAFLCCALRSFVELSFGWREHLCIFMCI
jgi:hypothetical protein